MSKSDQLFWLGIGMMALGATRPSNPTAEDVAQVEARLWAKWLEDNADTPVQKRHPERANFNALLGDNPTKACGLSIGDPVSIHLYVFQGKGTVTAINTVWEETHGTLLYPMFYVRIDEDLGNWFNRAALRAKGEPLNGAPPLPDGVL